MVKSARGTIRQLFFALILGMVVSGCTTISIPSYVGTKNPYKKKFYANFDEAVASVTKSLEELGWKVEAQVDPSVYESDKTLDPDQKHTLIFSDTRQTRFFVGSRYARLNIYMSSAQDSTEIEIRYMTVTSIPFKTFYNYKNDKTVERIFKHLQEKLS